MNRQQLEKKISVYKKLPKIIAITVMILFCVWGIVDVVVFQGVTKESHYSFNKGWVTEYITLYGQMQLESAFGVWILWQIIGGIFATVIFFVTKGIVSSKIAVINTEIRNIQDKERLEKIERERKEQERIRKENEKKEMERFLLAPEPTPSLIAIKKTHTYKNEEEKRLNQRFIEFLDAENGCIKADSHYKWLSKYRNTQEKLQVRDESLIALDILNKAKEERDAYERKRGEKLANSIVCIPLRKEIQDIKNAIATLPYKLNDSISNSALKAFLNVFSPIISLSNGYYLALGSLYCVCFTTNETAKDYCHLHIVEYAELDFKVDYKTEWLKAYESPKSSDDIVRYHYLHETKEGMRNMRYSYENNPSYAEVYRGSVIIKYLSKEKRVEFTNKKDAVKLLEQFKSVVKLVQAVEIQEFIRELFAYKGDMVSNKQIEDILQRKREEKLELARIAEEKKKEEERKRKEEEEQRKLLEAEKKRQAEEQEKIRRETSSLAQDAMSTLMKSMSGVFGEVEKAPEQSTNSPSANSKRKKTERKTEPSFTEEELKMIMDARAHKRQMAEDEQERKKKIESDLKLNAIGEAPIVHEGNNRTITNNLFSFSYRQNKGIDGDEIELFFVDELGNTVSQKKRVHTHNVGDTFKVTFELLTGITFDSQKKYYLFVSSIEPNQILGKIEYKINISFASDFDF